MEYHHRQRSPLDSLLALMGALPQGHDKPVKRALYNAASSVVVLVTFAVAWCLYLVLGPFVKPLGWALLIGSVLHPIKRNLCDLFRCWFNTLDQSHTPILIGICLVPFQVFDDVSDFIGNAIMKRIRIIAAVCIIAPITFGVFHFTPECVCDFIRYTFTAGYDGLQWTIEAADLTLISLTVVFYVNIVFFFWKSENNRFFHYASIALWIMASVALANQFNSGIKVPIFIALQAILGIGFIAEILATCHQMTSDGKCSSIKDAITCVMKIPKKELRPQDIIERIPEEDEDSTINKSVVDETTTKDSKSGCGDGEENKPTKSDATTSSEVDKACMEDVPETSATATSPSGSLKKELMRSLSQPQIKTKRRLWFWKTAQKKHHEVDSSGRKKKCKVGHACYDSTSSLYTGEKYDSSFYMYTLVWCCGVMLLWKNVMWLPLLPIPLIFYACKHIGCYMGVSAFVCEYSRKLSATVGKWCTERYDVLIPAPIKGITRLVKHTNNWINSTIRKSIDTVASCLVIFALIVFVVCASTFIVLQIYAEAIMLIQIVSNLVRQTVVHNPELSQILPKAWDETLDSILDNAYLYGRQSISHTVKSLTRQSAVEVVKAEKLEKHILDLWDRVYQSWMMSDSSSSTIGPRVTTDSIRSTWESFIAEVQRSPPDILNVNAIVDFVKQNIGIMVSVVDSVWAILKGNLSILFSSSATFVSILLGGGTVVVHFIINSVVFLTALFYLLSCSGDLYKPVEMLTSLSSGSSRLGHALEIAVNGVFAASIKMAAFYGLWTWFIHSLFAVKIIYLPTAIGAIFGAAPFLGTYWACFPAVLDLWLAQNRGIEAVIFIICHFLPTYFVDTTIYGEIKGGGHPYLTGLAIAGGIFYLGLEGAIIGPLLLCGVYVAIDLGSNIYRDIPAEEQMTIRMQIQDN